MIVKLDKKTAYTEGKSDYILYYSEDRFSIYGERRKKEKFLGTKDDKDLDFLDTLALRVRPMWDALHWYKKQ